MAELVYLDVGRLAYRPALGLQHRLLGRAQTAGAGGGAPAYVILVEHVPGVITLGRRAKAEHVLAPAGMLAERGIEVVPVKRGGDVTYHGPGQLVAYPIIPLDPRRRTVHDYVHNLEEAILRLLARLGLAGRRRPGLTGVWAGDAKVAAIGVAVNRWVSYHGLALNVARDLAGFDAIVPCGLHGASVTSLSRLLHRDVPMEEAKALLVDCLAETLGFADVRAARAEELEEIERTSPARTGDGEFESLTCDVRANPGIGMPGLLDGSSVRAVGSVGCDSRDADREGGVRSWVEAPSRVACQDAEPDECITSASMDPRGVRLPRLPRWLRRSAPTGPHAAAVRELLGELGLATVCASAQCPNRPECFARRTATFMILGDRCTRSCRFCAVAAGAPLPVRQDEPEAVAEACVRLGLRHVVITSVTRDDLSDGGAGHFARTTQAVRARLGPRVIIEILTPDFLGRREDVAAALGGGCDIFNHNVETVPRLYAAARPQADYRRSLAVLAAGRELASRSRAPACRRDVPSSCGAGILPANPDAGRMPAPQTEPSPAGETSICRPVHTKSGLMVGLGETHDELRDVMRDLRGVGCEMLTIGQYLAPSPGHYPVARFLEPAEFDELRDEAKAMGFLAVASGPFVRSSYRAEGLLRDAEAVPGA